MTEYETLTVGTEKVEPTESFEEWRARVYAILEKESEEYTYTLKPMNE